MLGADSAKKLLERFHQQEYEAFLLNHEPTIEVPAIPSVFWIGATQRRDHFKKTTISGGVGSGHVHFISQQEAPNAVSVLWETNPAKLKEAVRWGIIKPESVSGRVIAALGQYRVIAHKRIAKGMVSNTQVLKLKLLDYYQDRLEALQALELLVNKDNSQADYQRVIGAYIQTLTAISQQVGSEWKGTSLAALDPEAMYQFQAGISDDIQRAVEYLASLENKKSLRSNNRARGHASIGEFVKQQMVHGLYELQGINQDMTYSKKRSFALTRGELNDCIENARQEIDDYNSDPRNAITEGHHGHFQPRQQGKSITYDLSKDHLPANRERDVLLAISFIEGWDRVEHTPSAVSVVNADGLTENLDVITAIRWHTHRNVKALLKSLGYYVWNIIKGTFVSTTPWIEEAWHNPGFHLFATRLQQHVKPSQPMWLKPVQLFKLGFYVIFDVFKGVRNFGSELVIQMPAEIVSDWQSTKPLAHWHTVVAQATEEIKHIEDLERDRLNKVLQDSGHSRSTPRAQSTSELATFAYHLSAGESNDLLTSMMRGIDSFGGIFSSMFAKDPIAAVLFCSTFAIGGAAIYFPASSQSIFGAAYVNWFSQFSYAMGSSKITASIAGASTQGELVLTGWDILMHGPTSIAAEGVMGLTEDPLTLATYFGVAYGLGYILVNGIAGHTIPGLSETFKAELGTKPETSYPVLGAKFGIAVAEAFLRPSSETYHLVQLTGNAQVLNAEQYKALAEEAQLIYCRFLLVSWLNANAVFLPKLKLETLSDIARHIDNLFEAEAATALKKLLYPEATPSIAFQLISIPLTYIPAILRLGVSFVLSLTALIVGNPHPLRPIQQAGSVLRNKILKDLSRVLVFSAELVHTLFRGISSLTKMQAFTFIMAVGRISSAVNLPTGHFFHQNLAAIHVFFRTVGEFFYPVRATKKVVFAHPAHIIQEADDSYVTLLQSLHGDNSACDSSSRTPLLGATADPTTAPERNIVSHQWLVAPRPELVAVDNAEPLPGF